LGHIYVSPIRNFSLHAPRFFYSPWNHIFAHANKVWNIFFELF
jgi:hypothetical protein